MDSGKLKIQTSDEFEAERLSVQWEWNYQPRSDKWSLSARKAYLRLYAFKPINPDNNEKFIPRTVSIINQMVMYVEINVATMKMYIGNMADGQLSGLTYLSINSYSTFGIKMQNGEKFLITIQSGYKHMECHYISKLCRCNPCGICMG